MDREPENPGSGAGPGSTADEVVVPLSSASPYFSPDPTGSGPASTVVYTVAAPVLAGFAVGLIGFMVTNRAAFGLIDLGLTLAIVSTGALIFAMQVGAWAQDYYATPSDYFGWFPVAKADPFALEELRRRQLNDARRWRWYLSRAANLYRVGIIAFLGATAALLAPPPSTPSGQAVEQLPVGPILIGVGWLVLEVWWVVAARWSRLRHPFICDLVDDEPGPLPQGVGADTFR